MQPNTLKRRVNKGILYVKNTRKNSCRIWNQLKKKDPDPDKNYSGSTTLLTPSRTLHNDGLPFFKRTVPPRSHKYTPATYPPPHLSTSRLIVTHAQSQFLIIKGLSRPTTVVNDLFSFSLKAQWKMCSKKRPKDNKGSFWKGLWLNFKFLFCPLVAKASRFVYLLHQKCILPKSFSVVATPTLFIFIERAACLFLICKIIDI